MLGRPRAALVSLVVIGGALLAAASAGQAATLVHEWQADGDAVDAVAGANGSLQGNTAFAAGHSGQAFSFDGDDDYVSVPSDASFYLSGSLTIDGWASTTATSGQGQIATLYECAMFCPSNQASSVYEIAIIDGRAFGYLRVQGDPGPDSGGKALSGGPLINDGAFHHVALVRDVEGARLMLYVDAAAVADVPLEPGLAADIQNLDGEVDPLTIGAQIEGGSTTPIEDLTGRVDDVRVWSGAVAFDTTPPAPVATVTGSKGREDWYTGDVQVSWDVGETSVLRSSSGCGATSVTADTGAAAFTCEAASAGGSGSKTVTVKRDATAPAVLCEAAPSFARGAAATVHASVSDQGSGPAAAALSATPDTSKTGPASAQLTGQDVAGNTTTVACPFTVKAPPAAAAPLAVTITQIATLPPPRACVSRRHFPIRLRGVKANRIVRAQIKLNGKQVRNVAGKALGLPIDLRGLPKGKFVVQILTTDAAGRRLVGKRTYRTCVPKKR